MKGSEIMSKDTLFARLGGADAIEAAVGRFYDRLVQDPDLQGFFDGRDMAVQRAHQARFLTWAFGGPAGYQGRSLRSAHADLVKRYGLDDMHFDAVVAHLAGTLGELGVADELIAEVVEVAESVRVDVLGR